jgi:hypothetical protein
MAYPFRDHRDGYYRERDYNRGDGNHRERYYNHRALNTVVRSTKYETSALSFLRSY